MNGQFQPYHQVSGLIDVDLHSVSPARSLMTSPPEPGVSEAGAGGRQETCTMLRFMELRQRDSSGQLPQLHAVPSSSLSMEHRVHKIRHFPALNLIPKSGNAFETSVLVIPCLSSTCYHSEIFL